MDDQNVFRQFFRTVLHELFRSKTSYNIFASIILLAFVVVGFMWEERYYSSATLSLKLADGQKDSALMSLQLERVENVLFSRAFQQHIVQHLQSASNPGENASLPYNEVFDQRIQYQVLPRNLLQFSLVAKSPAAAKQELEYLISALNSRLAPGDGLVAVNQQISVVDAQIAVLKTDKAEKQKALDDITAQQDVSLSPRSRDRVLSVREAIQDVEVSINASNAKIDGILRQLKKEEEVFNLRARLRALSAQKEKVNIRLEEALSVYSSTSPEVVSLQQELDNINIETASIVENPLVVASNAAEGESLYEQLRKQLTLERVERESLISRHASLEKILLAESKKDSANQVQIAAITTAEKALNDVLTQEKALMAQRVTLIRERDDILASSPQLKIIDAPSEPQKYSGLGFIEFLLMGPVFAFGLPFLIASTLVITDTRIRTLHKLRRVTPRTVPIFGVIPHYNSPKTMRLFRKAVVGLAVWGIFVFSVYFTVGVIGIKGM